MLFEIRNIIVSLSNKINIVRIIYMYVDVQKIRKSKSKFSRRFADINIK